MYTTKDRLKRLGESNSLVIRELFTSLFKKAVEQRLIGRKSVTGIRRSFFGGCGHGL